MRLFDFYPDHDVKNSKDSRYKQILFPYLIIFNMFLIFFEEGCHLKATPFHNHLEEAVQVDPFNCVLWQPGEHFNIQLVSHPLVSRSFPVEIPPRTFLSSSGVMVFFISFSITFNFFVCPTLLSLFGSGFYIDCIQSAMRCTVCTVLTPCGLRENRHRTVR